MPSPSEIRVILEERGSNYGPYGEHAKLTQDWKDRAREHEGWWRLSLSQREAIDMIFHKLGRIINGNPDYKDSWTDIRVYVQLVEDEL